MQQPSAVTLTELSRNKCDRLAPTDSPSREAYHSHNFSLFLKKWAGYKPSKLVCYTVNINTEESINFLNPWFLKTHDQSWLVFFWMYKYLLLE